MRAHSQAGPARALVNFRVMTRARGSRAGQVIIRAKILLPPTIEAPTVGAPPPPHPPFPLFLPFLPFLPAETPLSIG